MAALQPCTIEGVRFELDPSRYVDRMLLDGQFFEAGTVDALRLCVTRGMVALDVGTNFGYDTLLFARWVGRGGQVIAFEPTATYGRRLQRHLALNDARHVQVERIGLSSTNTAATTSRRCCTGWRIAWATRYSTATAGEPLRPAMPCGRPSIAPMSRATCSAVPRSQVRDRPDRRGRRCRLAARAPRRQDRPGNHTQGRIEGLAGTIAGHGPGAFPRTHPGS